MTSMQLNVLLVLLLLTLSHLTNSLLRPPRPFDSPTATGAVEVISSTLSPPQLPIAPTMLLNHQHQHQHHHRQQQQQQQRPFLLSSSPSHPNPPLVSLSKEQPELTRESLVLAHQLSQTSQAGMREASSQVEWNGIKSPTSFPDRLIDSIVNVNTSTTSPPFAEEAVDAASSFLPLNNELQLAPGNSTAVSLSTLATPIELFNTMANKSVEQKWLEAANVINSVTQSLLKASMPFFAEFFVTSNTPTTENDHNISPTCLSSLIHVINAIQEHKKWAYSFIDSSGRLPSGLLTGTLTDLGDFDQCRSIRVNSGDEDAVTSLESSDDSNVEVSPVLGDEEDNEDGLLFRGSYCIAKFRPALPRPAPADISMDDVVINFNSSEQFKSLLGTVFDDAANLAQGFYSLPIHIALCVPSTCSVNDTTFLLSKLASPLHMTVSLDGNSCDSFNDSFALSFHQKISLITLTLLFLIVIICTLIDVTRHSNSFTLTKCSLNLTKTTSADFNEKDKCQPSKSTINCATDELVVGKNATINTVPSEGHSLSVNENIGCSTLNSVYRTPATVNESVCKNASTCPVTSEMGQPCAKLPDGRGEKPLDSIIIESFSLITNVGKLFTTKHNTSDTRIHFIHGTRVLTMVWIVICHTYTFGTQFLASVGSVRIEEDIRPKRREFLMQFILNGWFSVETFFFLSGYILVYIVYPVLTKTKGKLNFISYVSLRWLRFTPSLIGILIVTFLWPLLGSGPVFKLHTSELLEPCYNSWWKNILYINNFASHHSQICMKHTWYIAADFQLHVLAFASLWLFYWYKKYAFVFNGLMVLLGMVIPAAVVYALKLPPTLVASTPYIEKFEGLFSYFYFPTYNHITPYFLGLITGYFVVCNLQISIKKSVARILWILLPMASICIVLSTVAWNRYDLPIEPITSSIYAATHRFIWCLFIAWIALSCSSQEQGMVRNFLSSSFWLPLSRISFQIYLVHFPVVYYHFLSQRKPVPFTHYDRLFMSCGTLTLSVVGALITYLVFEAPFGSLVKQLIVMKKVQKSSPEEESKTSTPLTVITVLQVDPSGDVVTANSRVNEATVA